VLDAEALPGRLGRAAELRIGISVAVAETGKVRAVLGERRDAPIEEAGDVDRMRRPR
jgi:hypothetical protein